MDKYLKAGYGGEPSEDEKEFARAGLLRADGGTVIKVYPLMKVTLGQAIVVVAGGKVYCLEAAWDGMKERDKERFRQAAAKGTGWIDRKEGAPVIPETLMRGGRWCTHKEYSEEARGAVRDPDAVAFGVTRPSKQSAGTVVVGGSKQDDARYCGTCGGATEAERTVLTQRLSVLGEGNRRGTFRRATSARLSRVRRGRAGSRTNRTGAGRPTTETGIGGERLT